MGLPYNERFTEAIAPLAFLQPLSLSGTTGTIGPLNMTQAKRVRFLLMVGTPGSSGTIAAKVQTCATSGGSFADFTGGGITTLTTSGNVAVEVRAETIGQANVGPWVQLLVTAAVAATIVAGVADAAPTDYSPANLLGPGLAQTIVL